MRTEYYMMRTRCKVCGAVLHGPAEKLGRETAVAMAKAYSYRVGNTELLIHECPSGSVGMLEFMGMVVLDKTPEGEKV